MQVAFPSACLNFSLCFVQQWCAFLASLPTDDDGGADNISFKLITVTNIPPIDRCSVKRYGGRQVRSDCHMLVCLCICAGLCSR